MSTKSLQVNAFRSSEKFSFVIYISVVLLCNCYSPALTASLQQLARMIPELRKDILEGLLKMLSLVLLGRPLQHPGAPKPKAASLPSSMSTQNLQELPDVATITLALRTLASFDFEGRFLAHF